MFSIKTLLFAISFGTLATTIFSAENSTAAPERRLPTLFVIGDSTVKNGNGKSADSLWGWGDLIGEHFDTTKIAVENHARGGRSSRTFLTEGLWKSVADSLRAGDIVLMQFGHNDSGPVNSGRARASLKGNGEETEEITFAGADNKGLDGTKETVHTYGWYLRKFIADAKEKGATAIVLSPIPRNIWKDGKVIRAAGDYAKWAAEAARAGGAQFIDLNAIVATHYDAEGAAKVGAAYFTSADHTHTNQAGAKFNAASVVEGIKALPECPLNAFLKK